MTTISLFCERKQALQQIKTLSTLYCCINLLKNDYLPRKKIILETIRGNVDGTEEVMFDV